MSGCDNICSLILFLIKKMSIMSKKNRDLSSPFSFLGRDLFFLMKRNNNMIVTGMDSVSIKLVVELNSLFDEEVVESSLSS